MNLTSQVTGRSFFVFLQFPCRGGSLTLPLAFNNQHANRMLVTNDNHVIARSEATWQSPGTIHHTATTKHRTERLPRRSFRPPRNDTEERTQPVILSVYKTHPICNGTGFLFPDSWHILSLPQQMCQYSRQHLPHRSRR